MESQESSGQNIDGSSVNSITLLHDNSPPWRFARQATTQRRRRPWVRFGPGEQFLKNNTGWPQLITSWSIMIHYDPWFLHVTTVTRSKVRTSIPAKLSGTPWSTKKTGKQNLEYMTTFPKFDVGLGNNLTPKMVNPSTPTRTPRSLLSPHLHLQEDVILSMFQFKLKDRS